MDWITLDFVWIGFDWSLIALDWVGYGLDWIGLEFFLELWMVLVAQNGLLRKLPEFCLVSCGIQKTGSWIREKCDFDGFMNARSTFFNVPGSLEGSPGLFRAL